MADIISPQQVTELWSFLAQNHGWTVGMPLRTAALRQGFALGLTEYVNQWLDRELTHRGRGLTPWDNCNYFAAGKFWITLALLKAYRYSQPVSYGVNSLVCDTVPVVPDKFIASIGPVEICSADDPEQRLIGFSIRQGFVNIL